MSATIIVNSKGDAKEYSCADLLTIGRDKENQIVLEDPKVSRHHAKVYRVNQDNFYLIDEASSNGTYLNAKKITLPTLLKDGDQISLGESTLSFRHMQIKPEDMGSVTTGGASTVVITPTVDVLKTTILVADIRSFTALSENIPIKQLTHIMNEWFHAVTDSIVSKDGVIDKFLGDCVYARWETGDDVSPSIYNAIASACALDKICDGLNIKYKGIPHEIRMGVGINFGIAAIGTDQGNTAIGDAVNLAFRLEEQTKLLGKDIILSKDAYENLPSSLWSGKEQQVTIAGRKEIIKIWGLSFSEAEGIIQQ
jgi:adenylate cyclase